MTTPSTIPPPVVTTDAPEPVPVVTIPKLAPTAHAEPMAMNGSLYMGLPYAHERSDDEVP